MNELTIAKLGDQVGLSTKAIRYYESIGLITKAKRAENGYRMYSIDAVKELKLIKNARDIGLPISEIRKLMKGCEDDDCSHTKVYVESEIDTYIKTLDYKIEQMKTLQKQLLLLKSQLDMNPTGCDDFCCNILGQLASLSKEGGDINGAESM